MWARRPSCDVWRALFSADALPYSSRTGFWWATTKTRSRNRASGTPSSATSARAYRQFYTSSSRPRSLRCLRPKPIPFWQLGHRPRLLSPGSVTGRPGLRQCGTETTRVDCGRARQSYPKRSLSGCVKSKARFSTTVRTQQHSSPEDMHGFTLSEVPTVDAADVGVARSAARFTGARLGSGSAGTRRNRTAWRPGLANGGAVACGDEIAGVAMARWRSVPASASGARPLVNHVTRARSLQDRLPHGDS